MNRYTSTGWPSTDAEALQKLAGKPNADPPKYGLLYDVFFLFSFHYVGDGQGRSRNSGLQSCRCSLYRLPVLVYF